MPGKMCPKCHRLTLWDKGARLECSTPGCGYKIIIPSNGGMGGKDLWRINLKEQVGSLENLGEQRWADESEARNYLLRRCEEWLGCGDLPRAVRTALRPRGNAAWKYRRERLRRRINALRERILRERDE